ncbi:MAG: hypothetical protein WCL14_05910 [Bacteroidota bacterium]
MFWSEVVKSQTEKTGKNRPILSLVKVWVDILKTSLWKISYDSFEATCRQRIAPIVAAARCFVSVMEMQRLQRIAGRRWDENLP